jgi:hypothetical protein
LENAKEGETPWLENKEDGTLVEESEGESGTLVGK